jgi:hypothetical protein
MGDHDVPPSWLQRWREQEPLRLYLWSIAAAVLLAGVSTGVLTETWALAVGAVVSAVLMVAGTAAARLDAYAPLTVQRLLDEREAATDQLLDEQHALSYTQGVRDALERTPEQVAQELTVAMRAQEPGTVPRERLRMCPFMDEDGRRCTLPEHPRRVGHQLEAGLVG